MWCLLDSLSAQVLFVAVASVFGAACALITPPIQVPDESIHWLRVYQLSQFKIVGVAETAKGEFAYGGIIPVSIPECYQHFVGLVGHAGQRTNLAVIRNEFGRPLDAGYTGFFAFPATSLYSPIPYLPAAIFMMIARKAALAPIELLYFGRFGTLSGYVLIGWLTIRVTPILKWPIAMALTNPMCLFLAGSVSADAMTVAFAFLTSAIVLRLILSEGKLGWRSGVALIFAIVAVSLCKSAYAPMVAMVFAIAPSKWQSRRARWLVPCAAVVGSVSAILAWSYLTHPLHVHEEGDNPSDQLSWVVHHFGAYSKIYVHTLRIHFAELFYSSIGVLGWLDTPMLVPFIDFYAIALIWLCVAYGEPVRLGVWPRFVAALVIVASVSTICLATYLVWDKIGAGIIEGLQGRYVLPLVFLACIIIRRGNGYVVRPAWMAVFLTAVSSYTIWVLLSRYYLLI
jgi:uncharacterized membrane protein